jgi:hypothetical protein
MLYTTCTASETRVEGAEHVGRFPAVDADAHRTHQSRRPEVLNRPLPSAVVGPRVAPDVELLQVDGIDAEVFEALFGELPDVIRRIGVFDAIGVARRPAQVLRRNLRRDNQLRVRM